MSICKIVLCLFLTMGCNLSVEGHFWGNDLLPYIFLILNCYTISNIDWQKLSNRIIRNKTGIYTISILVIFILLYAVTLRIYPIISIVEFIKVSIKILIAALSATVILILSLLKLYEEKKIYSISFIILSLLEVFYFYLVKRMTDSFSIYPLLLLMLIYLSVRNISVTNKAAVLTGIGALCLALFETLGYQALTYQDYQGGMLKWIALAAVGTVVWVFIFYYVLNSLFAIIDDISTKHKCKGDITGRKTAVLLISMIFFRCLYWLNWFPALLSKDTFLQIQQALGNETYSNHNPWLHTMLIKLFMGIGKTLFGSNQAGVAVVAFASLLFSSILILFILKYYYSKLPMEIWWFAAVIFILDPIHCIYSVTIWKDVLFAYVLLIFCFVLMIMEEQIRQQGNPQTYMWAIYVLVSFVFCFSRTNGLYAWLFTLPFLLWHYRRNLKPWLISTFICLILIVGYKGWMLPHFEVAEPDMVEALSVPLQQIAFTIQNGGDFSEYDTSVINSIADMEELGKRYNAHISDPVKNYIRTYGYQEYITDNMLDFIKMYISVGVKNPIDYIAAFLNQSRGYWYQKMSNYIYFREGVHSLAAEIEIYRRPLFPAGISALADKLMDKYCDIWHTLWSLALNSYVVLILFVYSLVKKKPCFYFLPVIGVFITLVIATPVNDEFRYAYGIYLALPLLLMNVCAYKESVE